MRGLDVRQQLAESEGGLLALDEVARLLRISKTAVHKRLAAGRLLAWREERLQAARLARRHAPHRKPFARETSRNSSQSPDAVGGEGGDSNPLEVFKNPNK